MEVSGVEEDVRVAGVVQPPAQEAFTCTPVPLADAAYLRFGDAAGAAQRLHQGVDLADGDTACLGLHHHGVESLVDPASRLEWGYPDSVDRCQGSTGVSVRVLMSCCS